MKTAATLMAYLSPYSHISPEQLATPGAISSMVFIQEDNSDYFSKQGYTYVGTALIEVDVLEHKEIIANKVDALREEIKSTRAQAQARVTELEGKIQNLMAIEYSSAP
jgi:hypothetical protein